MENINFIGIASLVLAIVALTIRNFQYRVPKLEAKCYLQDDSNPSIMLCEIKNSGRGEAKDVYINFTNLLLADTQIFYSPDVNPTLLEAENILHPNSLPNTTSVKKVFSIHIPRKPAKDHITFELRTRDEDNIRAANQILVIRDEISNIIKEFGVRLMIAYPEYKEYWNDELVINARKKSECFFKPSYCTYEFGRIPIDFVTEEEQIASAFMQDVYKLFKKEFIDIFQNRPEYVTPVIKIKTSEGMSTYAIFPPYVKTGLRVSFSKSELKNKKRMFLEPPIPDSYTTLDNLPQ